MASERHKGLQIHRGIIYGSHARLLTKEEKLTAPELHTHKWTVFITSATSPPPKYKSQGKGKGRASEVEPEDINYIPGGADDLSWLIKRVTFKLHETYHQPNRVVDRPPFQVSETGWGEFAIQIRVQFAPETGEKTLTLTHPLRLHHWGPAPPIAAGEVGGSSVMTPSVGPSQTDQGPDTSQQPTPADDQTRTPADTKPSATPQAAAADNVDGPEQLKLEVGLADNADEDVNMKDGDEDAEGDDDAEGEEDADGEADEEMQEQRNGTTVSRNGATPADTPKPGEDVDGSAAGRITRNIALQAAADDVLASAGLNPLPVHSWQYDELVFVEPTSTLYELLLAHPPTPLPVRSDRVGAREGEGAVPGHDRGSAGVPLEFTLELERGESNLLDEARRGVVSETDLWRQKLIDIEKEQQRLKEELAAS